MSKLIIIDQNLRKQFIEKNSIRYLVSNTYNSLPNCLITEEIGKTYRKAAVRNFLLKPSKNGDYKNLITFVKDRPGHDYRYAIDSTKLQNELGWKPIETFATGIRKTIKWYLENEIWWREIQNMKYNQERLGA